MLTEPQQPFKHLNVIIGLDRFLSLNDLDKWDKIPPSHDMINIENMQKELFSYINSSTKEVPISIDDFESWIECNLRLFYIDGKPDMPIVMFGSGVVLNEIASILKQDYITASYRKLDIFYVLLPHLIEQNKLFVIKPYRDWTWIGIYKDEYFLYDSNQSYIIRFTNL